MYTTNREKLGLIVTADEEMAAFEAEIADDVEALEEREHEEAWNSSSSASLELQSEEQKLVSGQALDSAIVLVRRTELMHGGRGRGEGGEGVRRPEKTWGGGQSDIDSDEEREFEEFANDTETLEEGPSSTR